MVGFPLCPACSPRIPRPDRPPVPRRAGGLPGLRPTPVVAGHRASGPGAAARGGPGRGGGGHRGRRPGGRQGHRRVPVGLRRGRRRRRGARCGSVKRRPSKPLAVMVADLGMAARPGRGRRRRRGAAAPSPARPIVLVRRRRSARGRGGCRVRWPARGRAVPAVQPAAPPAARRAGPATRRDQRKPGAASRSPSTTRRRCGRWARSSTACSGTTGRSVPATTTRWPGSVAGGPSRHPAGARTTRRRRCRCPARRPSRCSRSARSSSTPRRSPWARRPCSGRTPVTWRARPRWTRSSTRCGGCAAGGRSSRR